MNYEKLLEEMKTILYELKIEQAGTKLEFNSFEDAVDKLKDQYEKGEILSYCDSVDTFEFQGKTYSLCLVLGISNKTNEMNAHGIKHYLDKHIGDIKSDKTATTIEDLIRATKNFKTAFNTAIKKGNIAFNYKKNRIVFSHGIYLCSLLS